MNKTIFAIGQNIIIKAMVLEPKPGSNLMLPKGTQVDKLVHESLSKFFDDNPFRGEVIMMGELVNAVSIYYPDAGIHEINIGDIVSLKDEHRLMTPLLIDRQEYYCITRNDITIIERNTDV